MAEEGLRERKKRQTRTTIAVAASELFAENGYDEVTVAEVARAADVSEQTVYNYFPTKEHLVFDQADVFDERLVAAVRAWGPDKSLLDLVREVSLAFLDAGLAGRPGGMPMLVAKHPTLRRRWLELADDVARHLGRVIVERSEGRLPPSAGAMLGRVVIAASTTVLDDLGRRAGEDEVRAALDAALAELTRPGV